LVKKLISFQLNIRLHWFNFWGKYRWTQNKDFEILKIKNCAGQTGAENAVKVNFPGDIALSKIIYTYSYEKFPEDIYIDTLTLDELNLGERKSESLFYKDKRTSSVFRVERTKDRVFKFSVYRLDKKKKKSKFDWGKLGQPKIYSAKLEKKKKKSKRKYSKWLLKEVTIYAKEVPKWFEKKEPLALHPQLSIENLLFGFAESNLGRDRKAANDGVEPHLFMSNLYNVKAIKVAQPSSAERENCGAIGFRYNNVEYKQQPGKFLGFEEGKSKLDIQFFNDNGYYEEDHLVCQPKVGLIFQVPNKEIKAEYEVIRNGWAIYDKDETATVVEYTEPVKVKEESCKRGTKACGSVEFAFTPQVRKTEIHRNVQYRLLKNTSSGVDTILVMEREPVVDMVLYDTAYIADVEIKASNESSYWNLEKNPNYNGAQYTRTGNKQINISKLNAGGYDLKVVWELAGIDIDTTVFSSLGDIDIKKYEDTITYIDERHIDIIDEGGKAEPAFLLFNTQVEDKCLSTNARDPKCKRTVSIPLRQDARYLIVGLDRTELDIEPSKIVGFGRNGELLDFNVNGGRFKNNGCKFCEQYRENVINWNGSNKLDGVLVFDLAKIGGSSISFEARKLSGDSSVSVFYQYITLTPLTPSEE
jgi:hypothetical protein